jgi:hypothetical protein
LEAEGVLGTDQGRQRADFNIEVAFNELGIALRKRPVDIFYRV